MDTLIWIHSINETESLRTLDTLCRKLTDSKFKIPVVVLTRVSQEEIYEKILENYSAYFEDLELIVASDEEISSLGKTKNFEIRQSNSIGVENIFMLDDDITELCMSDELGDSETTLMKWLDMHKALIEKDSDCVMTSVRKNISKSTPTLDAEVYGGICTQCTLINAKRAEEFGLFYRDNNEVGHEDVDFRAQLIRDGKTYYRFTKLIYGTEPLNTDTFSGDTLQERFTRQRDIFKSVWGYKYPWIEYTTSVINGVELDDVKINPVFIKRL